jgi:hypothetical protein
MNPRLFILKLLLFILPIASVLFYLEYKLAALPNSYNTKRHYLEQKSDSIEVIILGASGALYGINPSYLSHEAYNLADVSQDMYFDSALITNYLPKLPKLKLVIIEAEYMAINYSLKTNPVENWRTSYYYKYWGIKADGWQMFDLNNYSLIWLYTRSVVKEIAQKGFDTSFVKNLSVDGWMKYDTVAGINQAITDEKGKKRVEAESNLMSLSDVTKEHNCAENLVRELTSKNIKVEFISLPVYSTFRKYCDTKIITNNTQLINRFTKQYGCYYTDYFADNRFTVNDFYNNDHLNFRGAEKLSKIIDQDIIKPLLN